ncbi:MAG: NAD-dependent protein deacylase [Propionicimonas sp.]
MSSDLRSIIDHSTSIVFFGGAGVSTESGIPDFRSGSGLYSTARQARYAPEQILSRSFFLQHPEEFFAYYRTHLLYPGARPNAAHRALAAWERAGKLSAVVTQNIDGLHQAAGSHRVLELHGSVHSNTCLGCSRRFGLEVMLHSTSIPRCDACQGIIKPDVVLYEEGLDGNVLDAAVAELEQADTLIVGGTSLVVYPAAGLVHAFRGGNLVLINKAATSLDRLATLTIREPIGEALAPFVND